MRVALPGANSSYTAALGGVQTTSVKGDVTHLNRLVGGDEWKHEMEARAAGGGQESPASVATHTCTKNSFPEGQMALSA